MSTAAKPVPSPKADPLKVFKARAEARALLWHCNEFDLHEAVDALWADAERDGLVAKLGPDAVQRILANAFAPLRDDLAVRNLTGGTAKSADNDDAAVRNLTADDDEYSGLPPTFADACRKADARQRGKPADSQLEFLRRLLADDVSLGHANSEINSARLGGRAAASTVEAVVYALREYGSDALHGGNTPARLAELSNHQIEAVIARLIRMQGKYPRITDDLLLLLAELLP